MREFRSLHEGRIALHLPLVRRLRRGSAGGRPPAFDQTAYKGRNVIERSFNDHKQWRGIATRYDKLAVVYRGGVVLSSVMIWLRQ